MSLRAIKNINSASLDRLIRIGDPYFDNTEDSWNVVQTATEWSVWIPARMSNQPGTEIIAQDQAHEKETLYFTIRYMTQWADMRAVISRCAVEYEGRIYKIIYMREIERRRFLELKCEYHG